MKTGNIASSGELHVHTEKELDPPQLLLILYVVEHL